jgi:hypothetical protein
MESRAGKPDLIGVVTSNQNQRNAGDFAGHHPHQTGFEQMGLKNINASLTQKTGQLYDGSRVARSRTGP